MDLLVRCALIGDCYVGKSSFLSSLTQHYFPVIYDTTIGVDFATWAANLNINGKERLVKIHFWDTAGQERFSAITTHYFRDMAFIFLMFDLTSIDSFNNLSNWLDKIDKHADESTKVILFGNKSDLYLSKIVNDTLINEYVENHPRIVSYHEISNKYYKPLETTIKDILSTEVSSILSNLPEKKINKNNEVTTYNELSVGIREYIYEDYTKYLSGEVDLDGKIAGSCCATQ